MTSLHSLVLAAERENEDAGKKLALLGRLRRALDLADPGDAETIKYRQQLAQLETQYKADAANRAAERAQLHSANRVALLSSSSLPAPNASASSSRAQLLSKSREANESLVRTRNIIVQQLGRVTEVGQVLSSDAEKLRDTDKELHDYAHSLHTSGGMIKTLQRREMTDRVLIYLGFGFLVLVAAYIVLKRVWRLISPLVWLVDKLWGLVPPSPEGLKTEV
ncbi:hypothetical protein BASA81_002939 [Batrachochytrium salamandrivorans]|nr:hypothetical protein BASA81_002939 [Batrachochytrium salamandrivorans]